MFSYPSVLTDVLGAQKNCLIETVLLSTHNIYFGLAEKEENHFSVMHSKLKVCQIISTGLVNSTLPHFFTSASACRASRNFDISSEIFSPYMPIILKFCDAGQVPTVRYFEA